MKPHQLTHLLTSKSQEALIFRLLYRAPGWVGVPTICRRAHTANHTKRLSVLKTRFGVRHENKLVPIKGSTLKKSFYRLCL